MEIKEIELLKNKIKEIRNDYKTIDKTSLQSIFELQKLHEFLLQNYQCNTVYEKCKKQICIAFRNIKTKEFYNKYFDCSSIAPKRKTTCPLSYLIYRLNELVDYEIFIACNILQSRAEQSRQQQNFRFSNVLYVDEYSCAMKSQFRKTGNQMSGTGNHQLLCASLLAHVFI